MSWRLSRHLELTTVCGLILSEFPLIRVSKEMKKLTNLLNWELEMALGWISRFHIRTYLRILNLSLLDSSGTILMVNFYKKNYYMNNIFEIPHRRLGTQNSF
ncbi:PREDICTED: uncharacterized protein LOC108754906 [Trachymyrmex septentrionalis]|uniref:uncharacterized protein LOC108754906 n=1 Tax=Trachymyrmex septentrionalis TaxID=34720 RepID=UPI00084F7F82|nr:PREDICTED: uncharacterized protein LOC108754906 [Trachymyrmex septentrionalis]